MYLFVPLCIYLFYYLLTILVFVLMFQRYTNYLLKNGVQQTTPKQMFGGRSDRVARTFVKPFVC